MSKTLINLIDISLVPAALLVVGKLIGLFATIQIFQLPWTLQEIPGSFFSVSPAFLADDVIVASSYSDLIMYFLIAFGFSFVLIQATHFHDTHIKPRLLVKLVNNNLMGLVRSSFDIYHSATIWTIFLWMTQLLIWVNIAAGKTYLWIGLVTLAANVVLTAILAA
jgi:hypothetical protein